MKPYLEHVFPIHEILPARGFISTSMEHVIQVHPHWHPAVEILYYMNGCALQQVNDVFFTAEPGDIVIIGPNQLHSTYTIARGNCRILVLQFAADALLGDSAGLPPGKAQFRRETVYQNPIRTGDETGRAILRCVEESCRELAAKNDAYPTIVRAEILKLAGLLARSGLYQTAKPGPDSFGSIEDVLQKTFRLVDDSFAEELTLEGAAASSNLSITHFCRLFKRVTGMTFHEYLTFYRVNRAEKMLLDSPRKKMAEVAFDCGFGSVTSFIRNFKRYKHCAPSRYLPGGRG